MNTQNQTTAAGAAEAIAREYALRACKTASSSLVQQYQLNEVARLILEAAAAIQGGDGQIVQRAREVVMAFDVENADNHIEDALILATVSRLNAAIVHAESTTPPADERCAKPPAQPAETSGATPELHVDPHAEDMQAIYDEAGERAAIEAAPPQASASGATPRTDAELVEPYTDGSMRRVVRPNKYDSYYVPVQISRKLEQELNAANNSMIATRAMLQVDTHEIVSLRAELSGKYSWRMSEAAIDAAMELANGVRLYVAKEALPTKSQLSEMAEALLRELAAVRKSAGAEVKQLAAKAADDFLATGRVENLYPSATRSTRAVLESIIETAINTAAKSTPGVDGASGGRDGIGLVDGKVTRFRMPDMGGPDLNEEGDK